MKDTEKAEKEVISAVKEMIKEMIRADKRIRLLRGQHGQGKAGTRYERCQWIDVVFEDDASQAASILFYEDFIVDSGTGNLHPGRYGYVVFQKWDNRVYKRKAPNIRERIGKIRGIFIPIDESYRLETGICVLEKDVTPNEKANEVFAKFIEFIFNE